MAGPGVIYDGMNYAQWYDAVIAQRGILGVPSSDVQPTLLPPNSPALLAAGYNHPAARYSNAAYVQAFNQGLIQFDAPQAPSNNGLYMYVLAPSSAWAGAPPTTSQLPFGDQALISAVNTWDDITEGLPTTQDITNKAKEIGKDLLVTALAGLFVAIVINKVVK